MVDESLEDGELASRLSSFGRFLLVSRGAGLPCEASGSAVTVLSLPTTFSEGGLHPKSELVGDVSLLHRLTCQPGTFN